MVIAALAIPIWVVYFASSQGRSLLASKGFLSTMPEALWFGLTFGVFTAAFFLALGYIYGDAKRRQMPAWAWVIAASLIPNLIGFILYFVFRGPLLGPCSSCGKPIRRGEAFCSHCGCSQGSSIGRITADNRTIWRKKGGNNLASHKTEDGMKRERALQVVLVLVGLFYCFWGYLLFDDLWHSRWLSEHSDVMPMFLSLNTALGVCLLVAVNQPAKHRLMIAYGAWSSLAHGFTMTIMSAQAVAHGMHRKDSPQDIVIFGVIGVTLLALLPAKQPSPAGAPISEPRVAER
jgi:hypothetical protein